MYSKYRKSKLELDAVYHIYNRGNDGHQTFFYDCNYSYFLDRLKHFLNSEFELYSYCLMQNHFHLLGRVIGEHVTDAFRRFFQSFVMAVNKQTRRSGSLFEKTYCRLPVTTESHFLRSIGYINTNSRRHGVMDDYSLYPYSSYGGIIHADNSILNSNYIIDYFGGVSSFKGFLEGYSCHIGEDEDPFE